MRRLAWCIAAAALLLAACSSRSTQTSSGWNPDTQIGDFQFNMPGGWKQVEMRQGPELVPTDLAAGSIAYIAFLPPQTGNLRSVFDATWADFQKQFTVQQAGDVESGHNQNGFDYLRVDARVSNQSLGYTEFVLGVAQFGDRAEAYYWVNNSGEYRYRNALEDFEHSMQFGGTLATPPVANAENGNAGLSGLYLGYKLRGMAGLRTHVEFLAFFPDGNVIRYLPDQGLDGFNFTEALRTSRDYCGRYKLDGDQLQINWADNSSDQGTRTDSGLNFQGDEYFAIPSSDGLTLDGVYRREGTDFANRGIRFTPDGNFEENGMLDLVAYSGGSTSPGSGTYSIQHNTLWLNYSDGRKVPLSFYVSKDAAQSINVHTYKLVRE